MASNIRADQESIAVIIPTVDRTELLKRAVHSVQCQSVRPVKIVIVDNGLKSIDIGFEDATVEVVRTQPRLGPGKPRNIGARVCNTSFIAFLDDDDYWDTRYLEYSLEKFKSGNADAVVGSLYRRTLDNNLSAYKLFPSDARDQRDVFFKNPGFGGQNIVIKREVFNSIGGFDETLPASVDRDLAAKLIIGGYIIDPEARSMAVLCDHAGVRVRANQIRGNMLFIRRHWSHMQPRERYKALRTLCCRCLQAMKK